MRTLKKTLCLVLVVVMMAGLCSIGTSAAFADADKITYTEAADVLNAVGAIKGDDNGFRPTDGLTRAEACVIIARLCDAEDIKGTASFTDLAGYGWASNAIAYCEAEGYVTGNGDGTFAPAKPLTGYAFAKMLLCVLGYDAKIEEYVGANWEISVAKGVKANNLAKGIADFDGTATVTREQAAQMALNALKATTVAYESKGTSVEINGATIVTGATSAKPVTSASATYKDAISDAVYNGNSTIELGEELYEGKLTLDATAAADTDDFGRPVKTWEYKSKAVATAAEKAVVTYTADKNNAPGKKAIAADLKGYKFGATELKTKDTKLVGDGDATWDETLTFDDLTLDEDSAGTAGDGDVIVDAIAALTANGKVVEVYANPNTKAVTAVNTITYKVEKINAITTNKDGDVTYNLSSSSLKYDYADDYAKDDTVILHGTFAKGDFVLTCTGVNSTDLHVYPTTKVNGQQTATDGSKLTIGGTVYTLGKGVTNYNTYTYTNSTKAANYFLDQFGYVVASSEVETDLVYAVVNKIAAKNVDTGLTTGKSAEAEIVFTDGSKQTVAVSKINGIKTKDFSIADGALTWVSHAVTGVAVSDVVTNNTAYNGQIVSYVVDSDGKYELTFTEGGSAYVDAATTKYLTNKGVPTFGDDTGTTKNANTSTVYVVKTDKNGKDVFTSYTGFANVPSIKASGAALDAKYVMDGSKVIFVYIDASANSNVGEVSTTDNIFYAPNATVTTNGSGTDVTYTVNGILDGQATTITSTVAGFEVVAGPAAMAAKTFYTLTINEEGKVTGAATTSFSADAVADQDLLDGIAGGAFNGYLWNDKTAVYVINTDGTVAEGTVDSIALGDHWYVKLNTTGSVANQNTIKTLYIVVA